MNDLIKVFGAQGDGFWASVALVIFFITFTAIIIHTLGKKRSREYHEAAMLPLNGGNGAVNGSDSEQGEVN